LVRAKLFKDNYWTIKKRKENRIWKKHYKKF
jgi:hypothetical protein